MDRFIAVQEPTCTWAVFDTLDDVPAEIGNVVMIGLCEREAMASAASANGAEAARPIARRPLRIVWRRAA